MTLPATGRTADDVLGSLEANRDGDVRWKEGRAFSLAYYAGPEVHALANAALAASRRRTRSTSTHFRASDGCRPRGLH